jgi:peroxiredoxin family protein
VVDAGTITAVATSVGVTVTIFWGFNRTLNAKANKSTTDEIWKVVNADRIDIAELNKNVAVLANDFTHMTDTMNRVDTNIVTLLKNGKEKKDD